MTFTFKKAAANRVRVTALLPPGVFDQDRTATCSDGSTMVVTPSIVPQQTWYSTTLRATVLKRSQIMLNFPYVAKPGETFVHWGWYGLLRR